eukprot:GHVU01217692.1.p2 GENE.GHVU01217692.1~~GHVU01217692.1.p2  ORF type:complete len:104 (+),score=13.76 GHVU01217692.1:198-509(+)
MNMERKYMPAALEEQAQHLVVGRDRTILESDPQFPQAEGARLALLESLKCVSPLLVPGEAVFRITVEVGNSVYVIGAKGDGSTYLCVHTPAPLQGPSECGGVR